MVGQAVAPMQQAAMMLLLKRLVEEEVTEDVEVRGPTKFRPGTVDTEVMEARPSAAPLSIPW